MQYLKEEIRRKILENALEEFKKEGYRRSSLRRIAGKTGISAGNIYRYFQSKEELLFAIMNPIQEEIDELVKWLKHIAANLYEYRRDYRFAASQGGYLPVDTNYAGELAASLQKYM